MKTVKTFDKNEDSSDKEQQKSSELEKRLLRVNEAIEEQLPSTKIALSGRFRVGLNL